jgi:hypothetical protein
VTLLCLNAASSTREETPPTSGERHPVRHDHLRLLVHPRVDRARTLRNSNTALLRASTHDRHLALRAGVASTRRDRDAGVALESVRVVPGPTRLLLHGLELVRDPASEPVPDSLAWPAGGVVAGAGAVADQVRPLKVWDAVRCIGVQAWSWLVLTTREDCR